MNEAEVTIQESFLSTACKGFDPIKVDATVKDRALANLERWLTNDSFADAIPQIAHLIETEDFNSLFDAFFQQIPFGTGGRRGPVGFGTNRINPHTISTSIQGHCEFLKRHNPDAEISVVVAFDVRKYGDLRGVYDKNRPNTLLGTSSIDFARIAAQVYAANGIRVWFPNPDTELFVSTPELSFAIRKLDANGGLNISASHNHPDDNGAKIYNSDGGQEIPPLDEEMATIVEGIDTATSMEWDDAVAQGLISWIPANVHESYVATNAATTLTPEARSAKIVFSPLHGVGWDSVGAVLETAGFEVECLESQGTPDGAFPNVPFRSPNPEVTESLNAATERGLETNADLVLAADPDADRLGMVVPDPVQGWTQLNGNQIGTLLAAYMFEKHAAKKSGGFAITTVVTTSLFSRIARHYDVQTVDDLGIGFKYIGNVLHEIETTGKYGDIEAKIEDFVVGIEESHGYLVTSEIRDKDAAGAALLLAELVSTLKDRGEPVLEYLDRVYRKYGYVCNHLRSTVMTGARGFLNIRAIQNSLRENPPTQIGDLAVTRFIDRHDEEGPLGPFTSKTDEAARDLLTFELEQDARVVLRPSGTESKNKTYVEVAGPSLGENASAEELSAQKSKIDSFTREVAKDFMLLALERIDVSIPRWALDVSDLVTLESKVEFGSTLLALVERIEAGTRDNDAWLDEALAAHGSDGRLLVRGAVASYLTEESPSSDVESALRELFDVN